MKLLTTICFSLGFIMKYDISSFICVSASPFSMDSTQHSQEDELNLEELIKCVSLGKTAIDTVRSRSIARLQN